MPKEKQPTPPTEGELQFIQKCLEIPRHEVVSSNLFAIGYSQEQKVLTVEFKNAAVWAYHPIMPGAFKDLAENHSLGRYFNDNIKNNERVTATKLQ